MEQTLAERNKQLALKAFDALFNRHDYDAAATMWSEGYIQHSYRSRSQRALRARAVLSPDVSVQNALAVADSDYVVLYGRFSGHGQPRPMIVANILRIEDRRLAEHWDVIQDEGHCGGIEERTADDRRSLLNTLVANARRRCVVTNPMGSTLAEIAPSTPVKRREMP